MSLKAYLFKKTVMQITIPYQNDYNILHVLCHYLHYLTSQLTPLFKYSEVAKGIVMFIVAAKQ